MNKTIMYVFVIVLMSTMISAFENNDFTIISGHVYESDGHTPAPAVPVVISCIGTRPMSDITNSYGFYSVEYKLGCGVGNTVTVQIDGAEETGKVTKSKFGWNIAYINIAKPKTDNTINNYYTSNSYGGGGIDTEDLGEYMTGDKNFFFDHDEPFINYVENVSKFNNMYELLNDRMDRLEAMIRLNTDDEEIISFGAAMIKSKRIQQMVIYKDYQCMNGLCIKVKPIVEYNDSEFVNAMINITTQMINATQAEVRQ